DCAARTGSLRQRLHGPLRGQAGRITSRRPAFFFPLFRAGAARTSADFARVAGRAPASAAGPPGREFVEADAAVVVPVGALERELALFPRQLVVEFCHQLAELREFDAAVAVGVVLLEPRAQFIEGIGALGAHGFSLST